jgi:hypothetical protein
MKTGSELAADLRLTAELYELGLRLKRAQLARAHPALGPAELDGLLDAWAAAQPASHAGDRQIEWPRRP